MGKVDPTSRVIRGPSDRTTEIVSWGPISAGDEVGWYDLSKSEIGRCESVQIEGEFSGAKCHMEGSNTGIDGQGRLLHNSLGMEAIVGGVEGIVGIGERTRYIRPVVEGGDQSTKITVTSYGGA